MFTMKKDIKVKGICKGNMQRFQIKLNLLKHLKNDLSITLHLPGSIRPGLDICRELTVSPSKGLRKILSTRS